MVVATPETPQQEAAHEEAEQVFHKLGTEVHPVENVGAVTARAVDLVRELL